MRETVEKIKKLYQKRALTIVQIQAMLSAGKITQEEYDYIVGGES